MVIVRSSSAIDGFDVVQERTVATESLACLSQMLRRSRPLLQAMLGQDSLASVEFFYTRTVWVKVMGCFGC